MSETRVDVHKAYLLVKLFSMMLIDVAALKYLVNQFKLQRANELAATAAKTLVPYADTKAKSDAIFKNAKRSERVA